MIDGSVWQVTPDIIWRRTLFMRHIDVYRGDQSNANAMPTSRGDYKMSKLHWRDFGKLKAVQQIHNISTCQDADAVDWLWALQQKH